jgi:hypothetical protein
MGARPIWQGEVRGSAPVLLAFAHPPIMCHLPIWPLYHPLSPLTPETVRATQLAPSVKDSATHPRSGDLGYCHRSELSKTKDVVSIGDESVCSFCRLRRIFHCWYRPILLHPWPSTGWKGDLPILSYPRLSL